MKFGSKKPIFGVIWGGFEGFGPCLGISHPTHPHLGKISQKKRFFFTFPYHVAAVDGFHERDDVLDDDSMSRMLILPSCDQGGGEN